MRLVNRTVSHIYNRIVPYTIMTQNRFPTVYNFYRRIRNSTVMPFVKFPISVEVETITACNLRCSYCPNSKFERGLFKNSHMMETDVFYKLIDELAEIDYRGSFDPHFYGEPLLDPRLPQLMEYVRKKLPLVHIQISTNGILLTLKLYKEFKKAGVNTLIVSQHTPKQSVQLKKVFKYHEQNSDGAMKMIHNDVTTESQFSNRGGLIEIDNITDNYKTCSTPKISLSIDTKGDVVLCCNDYLGSNVFGNIAKEKLMDIWNKPRFRQVREEVQKSTDFLSICQSCAKGSLVGPVGQHLTPVSN